MYKYVVIIQASTGAVAQRFDVTDKSERYVDKLERGISINLDHAHFYIDNEESEIRKPIN
ncbi:MAG: hypothetical protein GY928_14680 [Colwellia sp.]|nr:hypothetical protein [Colwellia sp.]